jgi:hypothetical protein
MSSDTSARGETRRPAGVLSAALELSNILLTRRPIWPAIADWLKERSHA